MATTLETAISERDAKWRQAFRSIMFGGPLPNDLDYVGLSEEFVKVRNTYWENAKAESDRANKKFVQEMLILCADAIKVANAARRVEWAQVKYDGPQPLRQFVKAVQDYAAASASA